jgi:hypothetical protein
MLPELPWTTKIERTPRLLRLLGFKPYREIRERHYAGVGGWFEDREVRYLDSGEPVSAAGSLNR